MIFFFNIPFNMCIIFFPTGHGGDRYSDCMAFQAKDWCEVKER